MKILTILSALLLFVFYNGSAQANGILELNAMDFGVFSIVDSNAHDIVVSPFGVTTPDAGVYKLKPGRNGAFRITGLDMTQQFYITIDPVTLMHSSGSPSLSVDHFTFDPPNDLNNMIHTDADNSLVVKVGATLHIDAGTTVNRGPYRGLYNFMINF